MKKLATLLVLALVSAALVACGDDDSTTTTETGDAAAAAEESGETSDGRPLEGNASVTFEADPSGALAYTEDQVVAKAGEVKITFENPTAVGHDVAIEDSSGAEVGKTEVITEGSDSTVIEVKEGEYTFYCTVPGHREGGMEGPFNVVG